MKGSSGSIIRQRPVFGRLSSYKDPIYLALKEIKSQNKSFRVSTYSSSIYTSVRAPPDRDSATKHQDKNSGNPYMVELD